MADLNSQQEQQSQLEMGVVTQHNMNDDSRNPPNTSASQIAIGKPES